MNQMGKNIKNLLSGHSASKSPDTSDPTELLGNIAKSHTKFTMILMALGPLFPILLVIFLIIIIGGNFSSSEGYYASGGSSGYCTKKTENWAEYSETDKEKQTFYKKLSELVDESKSSGKPIDEALILSILFYRNPASMEEDYSCEEVEIEDVDEVGNATTTLTCNQSGNSSIDTKKLYNEVKDLSKNMKNKTEDEFKEWVKENYAEKKLKEAEIEIPDDPDSKNELLQTTVDEMYAQRDQFVEMTCDEENTTTGISSCSYQVNGKEVKDVKVEVLSCDGKEVEFTVDFEKYIAGVVFAENRGAPDEAIKAQAIVARSFALTRQNAMCPGNPEDCDFGYNPKKNVIRLRGCENDQVYCDPEAGCTIVNTSDLSYGTVRTWKQGKVDGGQYIAPFTGNRKERFDKLLNEVAGQVLVDEKGNVVYTNFTNTEQNAWAEKAKIGQKYNNILLDQYKSAGATGLATQCASTGEVLPGIKFPIAEKFYSAQCYSAGEYYAPGDYHGAIDFGNAALFAGKLPDSATVKIVSSTNGKITNIGTDRANTWPSCKSGGAMGGMGYRILIDQPGTPYDEHTIVYWHLDQLNPKLKVGDMVKAGDFLGTMGNTGCSTGKHLHWQLISPTGTKIIMDSAVDKYCAQNYTKG